MEPTLTDLPTGTDLLITGYQTESAYTAQLRRLGLVPGTRLRIIRRAPLGDPMEIRLRGYSLALRPNEADTLQFEVIPT